MAKKKVKTGSGGYKKASRASRGKVKRVAGRSAGDEKPAATVLRTKPPRESREAGRERMREIITRLRAEYPDSKCSLDFETPFQLLIATVLSAQCTDERVNKTTPALFARFPTAEKMADAGLPELEQLIRPTGFYKNKAKAIQAIARDLRDRHGGQVPRSLDELVELRGVGRKTANVVLGVAFGVPGMVVDTHVTRLTNRLGYVTIKDAVKIEHQMMEIVEREDWIRFTHLMIDHGRAICTARKALCGRCVIADLCPKVGVPRPSKAG